MAPGPRLQQQSRLQIPTAPNFPLSSPITEEVPSPTSTSSDDRDLERSRPFQFLAKMAGQGSLHRDGHDTTAINTATTALPPYPVDEDRGSRSKTATPSKKGPVGLNLVTDFSRPTPTPASKAQARTEPAAPAPFIDLNDLKVLSKVREKERSAQSSLKGILKKGTTAAATTTTTPSHKFQRLPDDANPDDAEPTASKRLSTWFDLKPRVSPRRKYKDDLSPSDRPIMIGFSMPYGSDSGDSHKDRDRSKELDSAGSSQPPLTPSIIVTPAKANTDFWPDFSQIHHHPRATSSIYSQPTPYLEQGGGAGIPPVPAIPPHHTGVKSEVATPVYPSSSLHRQSIANSTRRLRSYSTGTVFEEDNDNDTWRAANTRSRSYSTESAKRAFDLGRLSAFGNRSRMSRALESPNRPVSQGWWTYLLSPLLDRSNTFSSRKTPTDAKRCPLLTAGAPTPTTTRSGMSDEWWEKEVSCFSPDTPETAAPVSASRGGIASWQNVNTNQFADRAAIDPDADTQAGAEAETTSPAGDRGMSFMFGGKSIPGAAAEYYQACAHELFSKTPYFECVNHVCSITPVDKVFAAGAGIGTAAVVSSPTGDVGGARGILVDLDDDQPQRGQDATETTRGDVLDTPSVSGSRGVPTDVASSKGSVSPPPQPPVGSETTRSIEESARGAPAVDDKEDSEKSPPVPEPASMPAPAEPQGEKQAPFPFLLPNGVPPGTHVYFQSAPTPSPAPVAPTERSVPHYIVVQPPNYTPQAPVPVQAPPPTSPGPTSPGLQCATEQTGSIPLGDMHTPAPAYTAQDNSEAALPPRMDPLPMTREAIVDPTTERHRIEARRRRLEKEDRVGRKAGGLWRGRGCISNKGCFGRPGREGRLRRRWYAAIALFFIAIVVTAILLAILLTRRGDETPVESQWLNLTGYPPMPTGIATIAGPEAKVETSGCITPSALWSCALPNEQQEANKPYAADQPNFRVEIRFRNGTYPNSTTVVQSKIASRGLDDMFNSSPAAPDMKDQAFLGNTTDDNSAPYEGEVTPFYMTLLSPFKTSSLTRRADGNTTDTHTDDNNKDTKDNNSNAFPDIDKLIPSPSRASDGTAAEATLYPLPSSQPIRLYNRGQDNEHYGFYTYFDRSIFLESTAPLTAGTTDESKIDANGGPSKANARVRCTWSQTRFLVQIWTRPGNMGMALLGRDSSSPSGTATSTSTAASSTSTPGSGSGSGSGSSANDFSRPGSFPYPVTITLDRHGGTAKEKMVYCYGMETAQRINATEKKLQVEDRSFGGTLVNAAPGIFNLTALSDEAEERIVGDYGGVDGGTGGCACQWGNWISGK